MDFNELNKHGEALAGSPSRGDQALYKTWSMKMNTENEELVVRPGIFVAVDGEDVKLFEADTDVLAGIIIRTGIYRKIKPYLENVDVCKIGHGDGIWAMQAEDSVLEAGDPVYIVASGDDVGKATSEATGNKSTKYIASKVRGNLVEVTRKEDE